MAVAAPFIIAAVAVMGAVSAIQEGEQRKRIAEDNAFLERQRGEALRKQAAFAAAKIKREGRALKSAQLAAAGAGGGDLTGSPLDIIADSAAKTELDVLAVRYNAELGVRQAEGRSTLFRAAGENARTAARFKAGTSLLLGASAIAGGPPTTGLGFASNSATNPVATSGVHP